MCVMCELHLKKRLRRPHTPLGTCSETRSSSLSNALPQTHIRPCLSLRPRPRHPRKICSIHNQGRHGGGGPDLRTSRDRIIRSPTVFFHQQAVDPLIRLSWPPSRHSVLSIHPPPTHGSHRHPAVAPTYDRGPLLNDWQLLIAFLFTPARHSLRHPSNTSLTTCPDRSVIGSYVQPSAIRRCRRVMAAAAAASKPAEWLQAPQREGRTELP